MCLSSPLFFSLPLAFFPYPCLNGRPFWWRRQRGGDGEAPESPVHTDGGPRCRCTVFIVVKADAAAALTRAAGNEGEPRWRRFRGNGTRLWSSGDDPQLSLGYPDNNRKKLPRTGADGHVLRCRRRPQSLCRVKGCGWVGWRLVSGVGRGCG